MTEVMEKPKAKQGPPVHPRIIQDIRRICETANVPEKYVMNSMRSVCNENEIEWVRCFNSKRRDGVGGLVILGTEMTEVRCMAITGTLVRNFVDARIMTLGQVLEHPADAMVPSCLVVPNFFIDSYGKQFTAWQLQAVYDVMLNRLTQNKPTVVCVQDLEKMGTAYGPVFENHLREHYEFA